MCLYARMVAENLTSRFSDNSQSIGEPCTIIYPTFQVHKDIGIKYFVISNYFPFLNDQRLSGKIAISAALLSFNKSRIGYLKNAWRRHAQWPAVKIGQNVLEQALKRSPQICDGIFRELCETYPDTFFATEEDFLRNRDSLVAKYIEENCRGLAVLIMDNGYQTTYSHGYGEGYKGVYWHDPYKVGDECFFTSIMNGKTYRAVQGVFGRPIISDFDVTVDPGFDVSQVMPEGWDAYAVLEADY